MADEESVRVLVVDDHRMFAQGLAEALSLNVDILVVGIARGVDEACAKARALAPDVVLMDYRLSDGDGVRATQLIKSDRPETKIVMVTSFTDESVLLAAIEAGCSGFLPKDESIDAVIAAVRTAHAGEASIPPSVLARLLPKLRQGNGGVGSTLSPRETEVLQLMSQGLSNQAIAEQLFLSLKTVRNHVQNIIVKLNTHSKLEAVCAAAREGIVRYS